ncbi:MAG: carboxypeptidase-like regulatory domain-containing protein [Planctomycetota bacterium]
MLALDEPFRTTLFLAFVEDESVRSVARRTGVARSTASDRIQEGLARLRTRLDRAYDGDRRAWASVLAPLVPSGAAATHMTASLAALAIGLPLAGAVTLAVLAQGKERESSPAARPLARVEVEARKVAQPSGEVELAEPAPPGSRVALEPGITGAAARPEGGLSARILLPGGAPAAGAVWTLEGSPDRRDLGARRDAASGWTDLEATIGADGRLVASFEPPPSFQFVLKVECEDYVTEGKRLGRLAADEVEQLGTIELRPGGSVAGRIVDSNGAPLVGTAWNVMASELGQAHGIDGRPASGSASADPATATYRIDRLPAGGVEIDVFDERFGRSRAEVVTIVAGETRSHDIVLREAEPLASRVAVRLITPSGPDGRVPDEKHVWLVASDGQRRHARREVSGSWCYLFDDVGPGTLRVEVRDPAYQQWSRDDVTAGMHLRTHLLASAAFELDVRTPAGESVTAFIVKGSVERPGRRPWEFHRSVEATEESTGRIEGMFPGSYVLTIRSGGGAARVDVVNLAPGESRAIRVTLEDEVFVRGRVLHPDGAPAAGVFVRLVVPATVDDSPTTIVLGPGAGTSNVERVRRELARTTTDETGTFELPTNEPGRRIVIAGGRLTEFRRIAGPTAESAPFHTRAIPDELTLEVKQGGSIRGQVEFPAGVSVQGRQVVLFKSEATLPWATARAALDADGHFEMGSIAADRYRLYLQTGSRVSLSSGVVTGADFLGDVEIVDGEVTVVNVLAPHAEPASVTFDLTPAELAASPVVVTLRRPPQDDAHAVRSGQVSELGAFEVEAGTYDVWISGEDWEAVRRGVQLDAGEDLTVRLDISLTEHRVRFRAGNTVLAHVKVKLEGARSEITTDALGFADLRLGGGTYEVLWSNNAKGPDLDFFTATFDWPLLDDAGEIVLESLFR